MKNQEVPTPPGLDENQWLRDQMRISTERFNERIEELNSEIDRLGDKIQWIEQNNTSLKLLLTRAADALEEWIELKEKQTLIDDLRKAAQ